jgi:leader peptidase (prepilin peptidase)/N-methyltransferase
MFIIVAPILGLLAGWLINYLSDVLPTQRKFARPVCDDCGTTQSWKDYFLFRACGNCAHRRSWRTPVVLIVMIVISTLLWTYYPVKLGYWLSLLLLTYFGVVFVIDIEHRLILHITSIVGVAIGLAVGIINHNLATTLVGGAFGWGVMLALYLFGTLFARYRARRMGQDDGEEALGFGDVILAGIIGLMVGWPDIIRALFIAILAGGAVSLVMIIVLLALRRFQSMNIFTAYGPYLLIGATVFIFFPQLIILLTR